MTPLQGFEIHVSHSLTGCKVGVRQGGRMYLSPAMYELIAKAETQEELKHLLSNIRTVAIPKFDFNDPLPMVTKLDKPNNGVDLGAM